MEPSPTAEEMKTTDLVLVTGSAKLRSLVRPNDDSGPGLTLRDGRVEEASGTSDADDPSVTVGVGATSEAAGDDSNGDDDGDDVSDTCDALDDTEAAT
ncbi:hypothetical protein PI125_g26618 [Phytophthora idaei]|nr:hypothetical protein PI125_g26618 [Phytophthora idaei]